jgi:hypothetical protein
LEMWVSADRLQLLWTLFKGEGNVGIVMAMGWTAGVWFCVHLDWLWCPPNLLCNGYWVKQPGHEAHHSPLSSAKIKNDRAVPPQCLN